MRAKPLQGKAHTGTLKVRRGVFRSCCAILPAIGLAVLALPLAAQQEGVAPPPRNHWPAATETGDGAGPVDQALLEEAPTRESWLHYGGNYASWRHSPISELTPASAANLRIAWIAQTGVPSQLEASPVIYDGILYLTSSMNRLLAYDAGDGTLLWRYDHENPSDLRICCGPVNRGVGIGGDLVVMGTLDARLIAFNRKTGELAWNTEVAPYAKGFSITSAPLIAEGVAVIGVGGGEYGVRGFFDGYDMDTGERLWRHYTVPDTGEPGVETWLGESYKTGGAATWATGSYDPATKTVFWTTGNPSPDWNGDTRLGDNLYSDSVLAVDIATGERKWHFQFTPHDVWDYDGNSEIWLVDVQVNEQTIPAVVQANRNGYFYVLDRRDGGFLHASQYVHQLNWATLDENGRPVVNPAMKPADEPTQRVCPGLAGGNNAAYAGAYSPDTGLAYVPTIESCMMFRKGIVQFVEGIPFFGGEPIPSDTAEGKSYGHLAAIDVSTGETKWTYRDPVPMLAGVLSTAGGLVVTGNASGHLLGFDAETGEEVWRYQTGSGIRSHPVAYQYEGRTFLAVGSGGGGIVQTTVGTAPSLPEGSVLLVFELAR